MRDDSLRNLLPQLMGHVDDVRVPHAAGDVDSGVVEEEDEAHLINGAGTPLEKERETDGETCREGDKAGRDSVVGQSTNDAVVRSLEPAR